MIKNDKKFIFSNIVKLIFELGRYGLVGVIRLLIGVIFIFIPYNLWGVNYILCNVVGYSIGLIVGFILHKRWVFKSKENWNKEAIPYFVTFGIAYIINMILLILCAEKLMLDKNISQVIAICGFTTTNYLVNKYWTFKNTIHFPHKKIIS